jgi:prepilin-type N-terminal cleavage/methylation domain-containing protein
MLPTSTKLHRAAGFTITELLVVITVLGILIGLVLVTLNDFYQSNANSITQTIQSTDGRSALRTIERNVVTSSAFQTSLTVASPIGFNNDGQTWKYEGTDATQPTNRVLISKQYLTDKVASDSTRQLVYLSSGGCGSTATTPGVYYFVYFVKKDTATNKYNLYRRTVVPTDPLCTAQVAQKQTCAIGYSAPVCQAGDAVLLFDVSNFTVDYYSAAGEQTAVPGQYVAADISAVKTIKVTITTNRRINGAPTPDTSNIRITRIN